MCASKAFPWEQVYKTPNCWFWLGNLNSDGYGDYIGRLDRPHRLIFRIFHGDIPDGMYVLHTCDIRQCVNPEHLFIGTHADNMRDKALKGCNVSMVAERNLEKSVCKNGHPYNEENTYLDPRGWRQCKTCRPNWGRR